jgi:hypothetical protein
VWNNSAPTGRIFIKFKIGIFKSQSRKFKYYYNQARITGTLHEDLYTRMTISRSFLPRMSDVSDKRSTENQDTQFYFHVSLHRKSTYLEDQRDAALNSLYLSYCQVTLHVSSVSRIHHQEYTNSSYNHWYKS